MSVKKIIFLNLFFCFFAGIAFAVYKYLTPDYMDDFDEDFDDDFDDDFFDEEDDTDVKEEDIEAVE